MAKSTKAGLGCMILFCLPFALVGVGAFGYVGWMFFQSVQMQRWEPVPATILTVELKEHYDSDSGTSYATQATYSYVIEGTEYRGDRVGLHGGSDNIGNFQHRVHDELEAARRSGRTVPCYVDPGDPQSSILYPEVRWEMVGFALLFGLVFGGVGFGIITAGILGAKQEKREGARQAERPEEPWLWRDEWKSGAIRCSSKGSLVVSIIFALLWNLISTPALFALPGELADENYAALFILLFPLVGLGLLLWALYEIAKWMKYGESSFEMATVPGVVGGYLAGTVQVDRWLEPPEGFRLRLVCIHRRVTGSGKNRSTREDVLWEDSQVLSHALDDPDRARTVLPVHFQIPFDCEPSTPEKSDTRTLWRLEVTAAVPGVDYKAEFEVPVFKTDASSETPPEVPDFAQAYRVDVPESEALAGLRIGVIERIGGGIEVLYPALRNFGATLGLTIFTVIWGAVVVFLWHSDAPMLFPIVFGIFGALLLLGTLDSWFGSWRVEVYGGGINISKRYLGIGSTTSLQPEDVRDIHAKVSSQSGKTTYYSIRVQTPDKTYTAGSGIKGKAAADHIVEQMWTALRSR